MADVMFKPTRAEVDQLIRFSKPWRTHGLKGVKYPDLTGAPWPPKTKAKKRERRYP